jgi:hypothetical protein
MLPPILLLAAQIAVERRVGGEQRALQAGQGIQQVSPVE